MSEFGDSEPEDSWDAGDATPILTKLLFRMVAALDGGPAFQVRTGDPHDEILKRVAQFTAERQTQLTLRQATRVFQIIEGIVLLRERERE